MYRSFLLPVLALLGTSLFGQPAKNGQGQAPVDKAAPHVKLATPANRSTVAGSVLISGSVSDNVGVTRLELYIDEVLQPAQVSAAPLPGFLLKWSSPAVSNGAHVITVKAYDAAGNSGLDRLSVSVNNQAPPAAPDTKTGGNTTPAPNGNGGNSTPSAPATPAPPASNGNSGNGNGGGDSAPTAPSSNGNGGGSNPPAPPAGNATPATPAPTVPAPPALPPSIPVPNGNGNSGNGNNGNGNGNSGPAQPEPPADSEHEPDTQAPPQYPFDPAAAPAGGSEDAVSFVPGQIMVQARTGISDQEVSQKFAAHGAKAHRKISQLGVSVIRVPAEAQDQVSEALMKSGLFSFVEPDHVISGLSVVPNDPNFSYEWHLNKIQAPAAWDRTTGSSSQVIAIIDSGVDPNHEDLASKLVAGYDYLGTGSTSDVNGHGTAVAGLAGAASNNGVGVTSVAWGTKIMPIRIVDSSGNSTYSAMANAITWAADHGARIISMSLAGSSASSTLQSAVNYAWNKGAVIFAAAGNYSTSSPYYPAACDNVVAVGATDANDGLSSYSNYGSWVDLVAPGDNLMSTSMGGGYGYYTGTSGSTPITAGVAALVLAANPSLSASALVSLLKSNTDDLGAPGTDSTFGAGRVNAYKAVTAALGGGGGTSDTTPPSVTLSSPSNGSTVSGTITVSGTANDSGGISKVELYVDNVLKSTGSQGAFSFSWNSTTVTNGSHAILVKAYDPSNNIGSATVTVNVSNSTGGGDTTPPTVSISSPTGGSTVTGTITVSGVANDSGGILKVELYVDNVLKTSDGQGAFSLAWNSTTVTNGSHAILVKAYDVANNVGSGTLTVNVSNGSSGGGSGDTTPPAVTMFGPSNNSTVSGTITISGVANDSGGISKIDLYVDNVFKSTTVQGAFTFSWNSTTVANGSHAILIKAYDLANNMGTGSVTVNVSNSGGGGSSTDTTPPSVSISAPSGGATVSNTVTVSGVANDAGGISKVELYVDNGLTSTGAQGSFSFSWNSAAVSNGSHVLMVKAYDPSGNVGSASVTVNVSNGAAKTDNANPTVTFTNPASGSSINTNVKIAATAWDDVAVAQVSFYIDGTLQCTVTSAPYTCTWNSRKATNGNHTISAKVWDTSNKTGSASITVVK